MFDHLFRTMNEALDHILEAYPNAIANEKQKLLHQWLTLREISNECIEGWLTFEEKMSLSFQLQHDAEDCVESTVLDSVKKYPSHDGLPEQSAHYQKGEGYFKLLMFQEASEQFKFVIAEFPNYAPARIYLSLCIKLSQQINHLQE
jgi:hypothetical protein